MSELRVIIVGAGLAGLTLAQSLRRHGADVAVFERDAGPWDRPQGYRLHLDADAINGCRTVLPDELRAVFDATAHRTEPYTTILGTDLSVIKRLPTGDEDDAALWPDVPRPVGHANVDRATLRQLLLAGLDDVITWGTTLEAYESTDDGVTVRCTDGTSAHGDVLVGADGIRSAVRRQRAPWSRTMDAGITAIYGRIPVDVARDLAPPELFSDIFTIAADDRPVFLGLGAVCFPTTPERAVERFAPGTPMRPQDDYVVAIVGGRHAFFPEVREHPRGLAGADLQRIAAATLDGWPAPARALLERADPASFFPVEMSTSVPCTYEPPTNVTMLGDAVHAMTPTLGRGANLAIRDGALLGRALGEVVAGRSEPREALADHERAMIEHGFAVVREAAAVGRARMAQTPLPLEAGARS